MAYRSRRGWLGARARGRAATSWHRRRIVAGLAGAPVALLPAPAARAAAWVAGSDAPEKVAIRVGFMPLTDCAPVVVASLLGFDRRHGVRIVPCRASSWARVRDQLLAGDIDAAHALYGLVYGVHLGIGGPRREMAVLMTLNQNGQGLALSRAIADTGVRDLADIARLAAHRDPPLRFAHTFPTGTHAMWLYAWLASAGIDPMADVDTITVPPPQMADTMRAGAIDGFSVGEPWHARALRGGVAVQAATSQQVWRNHPEKVLGCTAAFVQRNPNTARALVAALLDAGRWIDASDDHRAQAAKLLARDEFVATPVATILPRMLGHCEDGRGRAWHDPHHVRFHAGGEVNFPYLSDGMWFLTQYHRWGLVDRHPDYLAVAAAINRVDLYRDAARRAGVDVPSLPMRSHVLLDGTRWDGSDPADYAESFAIRATRLAPSPGPGRGAT